MNHVDVQNFFDLPCHVYWKNRHGIYCDSNDYQARNIGFNKGSDLIGYTDFDFCWANEALQFQLNDKKVLREEKSVMTIEQVKLVNGKIQPALSQKMPLYNQHKKIIGVFGLSFLLDSANSMLELMFCSRLPNAISTCMETLIPAHFGELTFTKRERDVVENIIRGKTAKKIAATLGLSVRTIENYIANIKDKMHVSSKSELIEKIMNKNIGDL